MNFINPVSDVGVDQYETVAASTGPQTLGVTGATGDFLLNLLVIPTSVSPGAITITDGSTVITVFAGGTNSLATLNPFPIPIGASSVSGAWKVTTLAGATVIAFGRFT